MMFSIIESEVKSEGAVKYRGTRFMTVVWEPLSTSIMDLLYLAIPRVCYCFLGLV